MADAQPLQGDTGPIQTACNVVSTAMTMTACVDLMKGNAPAAMNAGVAAVGVSAAAKLFKAIL